MSNIFWEEHARPKLSEKCAVRCPDGRYCAHIIKKNCLFNVQCFPRARGYCKAWSSTVAPLKAFFQEAVYCN